MKTVYSEAFCFMHYNVRGFLVDYCLCESCKFNRVNIICMLRPIKESLRKTKLINNVMKTLNVEKGKI